MSDYLSGDFYGLDPSSVVSIGHTSQLTLASSGSLYRALESGQFSKYINRRNHIMVGKGLSRLYKNKVN